MKSIVFFCALAASIVAYQNCTGTPVTGIDTQPSLPFELKTECIGTDNAITLSVSLSSNVVLQCKRISPATDTEFSNCASIVLDDDGSNVQNHVNGDISFNNLQHNEYKFSIRTVEVVGGVQKVDDAYELTVERCGGTSVPPGTTNPTCGGQTCVSPTPVCASNQCVCHATSCGANHECNTSGQCVPTALCGGQTCSGTTPMCSNNQCVCNANSCDSGEECNSSGECVPITCGEGVMAGLPNDTNPGCGATSNTKNGKTCWSNPSCNDGEICNNNGQCEDDGLCGGVTCDATTPDCLNDNRCVCKSGDNDSCGSGKECNATTGQCVQIVCGQGVMNGFSNDTNPGCNATSNTKNGVTCWSAQNCGGQVCCGRVCRATCDACSNSCDGETPVCDTASGECKCRADSCDSGKECNAIGQCVRIVCNQGSMDGFPSDTQSSITCPQSNTVNDVTCYKSGTTCETLRNDNNCEKCDAQCSRPTNACFGTTTPDCLNNRCVCNDTSCGTGKECNSNGQCVQIECGEGSMKDYQYGESNKPRCSESHTVNGVTCYKSIESCETRRNYNSCYECPTTCGPLVKKTNICGVNNQNAGDARRYPSSRQPRCIADQKDFCGITCYKAADTCWDKLGTYWFPENCFECNTVCGDPDPKVNLPLECEEDERGH